ncbi:hypothetical protein ACFQ0B_73570 [Nonomuraea thailandensis]
MSSTGTGSPGSRSSRRRRSSNRASVVLPVPASPSTTSRGRRSPRRAVTISPTWSAAPVKCSRSPVVMCRAWSMRPGSPSRHRTDSGSGENRPRSLASSSHCRSTRSARSCWAASTCSGVETPRAGGRRAQPTIAATIAAAPTTAATQLAASSPSGESQATTIEVAITAMARPARSLRSTRTWWRAPRAHGKVYHQDRVDIM